MNSNFSPFSIDSTLPFHRILPPTLQLIEEFEPAHSNISIRRASYSKLLKMSFLVKLYLFFAFLLPGILAGETAPVPDCGSFETVCCDGEVTDEVPSIGAMVHGCSQCAFPLHSSPDSKKQDKLPP